MANEVVSWQEEMAKAAVAVAETERPSVSNISLKAGMMTIGGQPIVGNKLECVVILSVFENQYFPNPYDPDNIVPPECFAFSVTGEEMVPDPAARDKQNPHCDGCPQSEWGSAPGKSRGKACKEKRKLALLPVDQVEKGKAKTAEMAVITLPVMSVKNWSNYVNYVAAEYRRPPWGVVCEISTQPDPKSQFKVLFRTVRILEEEFLGDVHSRVDKAKDLLMTPYSYESEEQEEKPKAETKKRKF